MVPGLGLVALIAAEQLAVRADFWGAPGGAESLRFIFWAIAAAGVVVGRNLKARGPDARKEPIESYKSLSWTLVALAISPAAIGFVLSLMTRSPLDFFVMLLVSLAAFGMLFPSYRLWLAWSSPDVPAEESEPE